MLSRLSNSKLRVSWQNSSLIGMYDNFYILNTFFFIFLKVNSNIRLKLPNNG